MNAKRAKLLANYSRKLGLKDKKSVRIIYKKWNLMTHVAKGKESRMMKKVLGYV